MPRNGSDAKPQSRPSLRMLTLPEAAARVNAHPKTLRRRISEGHLVAYRMAGSRAIRIAAEDLDKLFSPIPAASGR